MAHDYLIFDVFTDRPFGGNPLAVFPSADALDPDAMQTIARELNLSETIFLSEGTAADRWTARIFTPAMELPYAGHPTIGAAIALKALGRTGGDAIVLDEPAGAVPVALSGRTATLTSPRLPEEVAAAPGAATLARLLGLTEQDLGPTPPAAWSAGVPFTFIPLAGLAALEKAALDLALWRTHLAEGPAPHVYAFCADPHGAKVRARMFAPAMGIAEDPATGAAATALAGLLAATQRRGDGTHCWRIRQGVEMGRPSFIRVEADISGGAVTAVRVGGEAVLVARGTLEAGAVIRRTLLIAVAAAAALLFGPRPANAAEAGEAERIVRGFLAEVRSGRNPDAASRYFAEQVQAHQVTAEGPTTILRSPADYAAHVREFLAAFGPFTLTVEELIAGGDRVFVRWRQEGRHLASLAGEAPTGAVLIELTSVVYRVENGRIAEYWLQTDRKGLDLQLRRLEH